jgi:DNA replication protein DnaC
MDEMGYFSFDEVSAHAFFQIVSRRYESGAMILTSNKSYIDWGNIFSDHVLATAVLDQLVHHSTTFNINQRGVLSITRKEKSWYSGLVPVK